MKYTTTKPPLGSRIIQNHPLSRDLVSCVIFNNFDGELVDLAPNPTQPGHNGSLWVAGSLGAALKQSATSWNLCSLNYSPHVSESVIPTKFQFNQDDSFSIFTAVTIDGGSGAFRNVLRSDAGSGSPRPVIIWRLSTSNTLLFQIGNVAGTSGSVTTTETFDVNEARVRYLGAVRNVQTDTLKIYSDGKESISGTDASTGSWTLNNPFRSAYIGGGGSEFFNGKYFLIYVWKRAITAEEIADLTIAPFQFITGLQRKNYYLDLGGLFIDKSDDLNNWNESVLLHLGLITSDSINNWSDDVTVNNLIVGNITVSILDRIDKPKTPNNPAQLTFPALMDAGVNLILTPNGPLDIAASDLDAFNDDIVTLGIGTIFSDSLNNLSDSAAVAYGITQEVYDSMSFHTADALSIQFLAHLTLTISDTLNNWSDTVTKSNFDVPVPPVFDSFSLNDEVELRLNIRLGISDQLVFSDALNSFSSLSTSASDTLNNWSDAATVATSLRLDVAVADTANNLTDAVAQFLSTGQVTYLRRYLNDVIN